MKKASSKPALLDTNVLLALAWPSHQFHHAAIARMNRRNQRWATCAVTELGFIRLSANPVVVQLAKRPAEAASLLKAMTADPGHVYLDSPPPTAEPFMTGFEDLMGYRQVTDSYLLNLAGANHAFLLTFDARLKALGNSNRPVEILSA